MSRTRTNVPAYQKHSSGRARVRTYDSTGKRVEHILPGKYGSKESQDAYANLLLRLKAGGSDAAFAAAPNIPVAELVLIFMEHAEKYYVDPITKKPTDEVWALIAAFRPLIRLYGDIRASEFGPLALKMVREAMISGAWLTDEEVQHRRSTNRPVGLARKTINKYISRIKLMFRWAVENEILTQASIHALQSVPGLRRGRSDARETKPVLPISAAVIDDTLPHLPPVVRDMVEVLLLTGMRCGELCIMRALDLDLTGDVWIYRPERHKGLWRGGDRIIAIGPRAQEIVRKYLTLNTTDYLFRPSDQHEIMSATKRASRKTPVQPSQRNRRKLHAVRRPGERFEVDAINRAISRACKRANIEHWHVHQLRHSASLTFSREMGLESARAALGHSSVDMSAMYAGHDLEAAKKVAEKVG